MDNVAKTSNASTFLLICRIFFLKEIRRFLGILKRYARMFGFYAVYGILPHKKQQTLCRELNCSKWLLEMIFMLVAIKSFFQFTDDSVLEIVMSFIILIVYFVGVILYACLGKAIIFISRCDKKENVEAFVIREYNFIFMVYLIILFLNPSLNEKGVIFYTLFSLLHLCYAFVVYFRSDKVFKYKPFSLLFAILITAVYFFLAIIVITTTYEIRMNN